MREYSQYFNGKIHSRFRGINYNFNQTTTHKLCADKEKSGNKQTNIQTQKSEIRGKYG